MTNREMEVFILIKDNPFISQQEIAEKLGLARSSVAVHIGNLMKKGYITGKGYILAQGSYVTVIGGSNIDIQGFTYNEPVFSDSNPGKIGTSLGGVGRNIAENLARIGVETKLLSGVGDDLYGKKILEESRQAGIDMENCLISKEISSSVYLSVLDDTGDMVVAVSDMEILKRLDIKYIRNKSHIIKHSKLVILDTNLANETIEYIVNSYPDIDFFIDPVSTKKALKIKEIIGKFHTIKPNKLEAEVLTGIKINTFDDIRRASEDLLNKGLKRVVISLGKDGVYYEDKDTHNIIKSPVTNVVSATGAGDAFMAGLAYSYINNYDINYSVQYAIAASIIALSHRDTINPNITDENIKKMIKELF